MPTDEDGPFAWWESEEAFNADQDEAEDIAFGTEPLRQLGDNGDAAALEVAFREHIAADESITLDPDNVDYEALAAFCSSKGP